MANQSHRRLSVATTLKAPTPFQYEPLDPKVDSIRVVIVEPTQNANDIISCTLKHVTFGEKPKYEALSYTWGDASKRETILLNGQEVSVGINLWRALGALRGTGTRWIWIDAISIDQENVEEKSRQLRIMPYIYQRAQIVLVFLDSGEKISNPPIRARHGLQRSEKELESQAVPQLKMMCENAYWKRVWIIQEISLARKIVVIWQERARSGNG